MHKKGMISRVYSQILSTVQDQASLHSRAQWSPDVGEFAGDVWDAALESVLGNFSFSLHKLSQLFILHRAYRTPVQLYRWGRLESPDCSICRVQQGNFIHMLWRCPSYIDIGMRFFNLFC
ncbi:unnamed protein product [Staurois parvus]|uniref:Reverse transcriptase zinc-binding domain-containing protein n=1 Tax=Staurois parvus TaxID=386267 RepID=A0ABN9EPM0_9NEOB|nr:unnamed protein product [Staurois parvus]